MTSTRQIGINKALSHGVFTPGIPIGVSLGVGSKKHQPRPRPVPQRTCVVCREVKLKRELLRIVRTPQGAVEVDETGKRSGRGAYICRSSDCLDWGLNKGKLAHSLNIQMAQENVGNLKAVLEEIKRKENL